MFDYFNKFYSWVDENPEKVDPYLIAVYFALLNRANKSLWKEKFAIILVDIQEMSGINSRTTMIKTLNKLEEFGFIKTVSKTQNQYKNRVICLPLNGKHMKSTRKPNENQMESNWTQNKDLLNDIDLINNKDNISENEISIDVFKKNEKDISGAWFLTATAEEFIQRLNKFKEEHPNHGYPEFMFVDFIMFYTTPNDKKGIRLNDYKMFGIQHKLHEWKNKKEHAGKYEIKTPKKRNHYE
jgi:hypothetical protein